MLRVGIIGVGFGAKVHLPAFLSLPEVEVVAVADSGSGRAEKIAGQHERLQAFTCWQSLIEEKDIDAVSVVTPPSVQKEIVCSAARMGKHVLCEKPFGRTAGEAMKMRQVAQENGIVNAVDFQFRFEPGISEMKRRIDAGAIGNLQRIEVTWLTGGRSDPSIPWSWQNDAGSGGGVLEAYGSHALDYVAWLADSCISALVAKPRIMINHRKNSKGIPQLVTADDECDLICELESGAVAGLRFSNCYPYGSGHRIECYGDMGRLLFVHEPPFTCGKARLFLETGSREYRPLAVADEPTIPGMDSRVGSFCRLANLFINSILGKTTPKLPDFLQGVSTRLALDAAKEAASCGHFTEVPERGSASDEER